MASALVMKVVEIADVSQGNGLKVMSACEKEGKTSSSKGNSGRKHRVDKHDAWCLVWTVRQHRRAMADKLCMEFNKGREHPVSSKTVRMEPHRVGIP